METPIKMDDLGVPYFWKHPHDDTRDGFLFSDGAPKNGGGGLVQMTFLFKHFHIILPGCITLLHDMYSWSSGVIMAIGLIRLY